VSDFQTLREALAIAWPEGDHAEPNVFTEALAALDALAAQAETAEGRETLLNELSRDFNSQTILLSQAKAERDAAVAKLAESEAYAKEGWDWLSEALDALGVKDVFGIAGAKAERDAAVQAVEAQAMDLARLSEEQLARALAAEQAAEQARQALRQIAALPSPFTKAAEIARAALAGNQT
jgi:hypothetical protein